MEYEKDLVSIVTPAYNAAKFIGDTIESVLQQTYQEWELIIVNDCSKDNTREIVERYTDERIRLINLKENKGAANAWNVAFSVMRGEYIAFLDADDIWIDTKLEEQIKFMKMNDCVFSFTAYDWIDESNDFMNKVIKADKVVRFQDYMKYTNIGTLTVILRRDSFIEKLYCEDLKVAWDFYMWGNLLRDGTRAYGLNKVLAHYRIVGNSMSRNKFRSAKYVWKIYRYNFKLNIVKSFYYFSNYALKGVSKYFM